MDRMPKPGDIIEARNKMYCEKRIVLDFEFDNRDPDWVWVEWFSSYAGTIETTKWLYKEDCFRLIC